MLVECCFDTSKFWLPLTKASLKNNAKLIEGDISYISSALLKIACHRFSLAQNHRTELFGVHFWSDQDSCFVESHSICIVLGICTRRAL